MEEVKEVGTSQESKPVELTKAQKQELHRQSLIKQQQERQQYEAWKKQLKAEIDDNELKIRWLESRDKLNILNDKYINEKSNELKRIKWIIDELVKVFALETQKDEMYKHFEIPVPTVAEPIKTKQNDTEDKGTKSTD